MKIVLDREDLLRATQALNRIVPRKTTLPVLQMVRIEADSITHTVSLQGTDIERWLDLTLPATVEKSGAVLVSGQALTRVAAAAPEGSQIELKAGDAQISVKAGTSRFRLAISTDEFPAAKKVDEADSIELSGANLGALLQPLIPAICTDETRHYLTGVFLQTREVEGGASNDFRLHAVATNSNMLGWAAMPLTDADVHALRDGVIVPRDTVAVLPALFADGDMVQIRATSSLLSFSTGQVEFVTRLIDGEFPQVDRVVPEGFEARASAATTELADLVKRLSPFSEGSKDGRAVHALFTKGKIVLAAGQGDHSGRAECPIDYDWPDCPYAFADRLLQPAVDARESKTLRLQLMPTGNRSPMMRIDYDDAPGLPSLFFLISTLRVAMPEIANDNANEEAAA